MRFQPVPMQGDHARAVVEWGFDSFYSFYDLRNWPEDIASWLDPENWADTFAVLDEQGELVGEYSFTPRQDGLEIGLTLRPDLNGKGHGKAFVERAVELALEIYPHDSLIIRVWELNGRARRVYEKAGFSVARREKVDLEGMPCSFLVLTRQR